MGTNQIFADVLEFKVNDWLLYPGMMQGDNKGIHMQRNMYEYALEVVVATI